MVFSNLATTPKRVVGNSPDSQQVCSGGEETRLGHTEEEPRDQQTLVRRDDAHEGHDGAPGEHEDGNPDGWAQDLEHDVAGDLEEAIRHKEEGQRRVVLHAVQVQVVVQAGDFCIADVATVDEGKAGFYLVSKPKIRMNARLPAGQDLWSLVAPGTILQIEDAEYGDQSIVDLPQDTGPLLVVDLEVDLLSREADLDCPKAIESLDFQRGEAFSLLGTGVLDRLLLDLLVVDNLFVHFSFVETTSFPPKIRRGKRWRE